MAAGGPGHLCPLIGATDCHSGWQCVAAGGPGHLCPLRLLIGIPLHCRPPLPFTMAVTAIAVCINRFLREDSDSALRVRLRVFNLKLTGQLESCP